MQYLLDSIEFHAAMVDYHIGIAKDTPVATTVEDNIQFASEHAMRAWHIAEVINRN